MVKEETLKNVKESNTNLINIKNVMSDDYFGMYLKKYSGLMFLSIGSPGSGKTLSSTMFIPRYHQRIKGRKVASRGSKSTLKTALEVFTNDPYLIDKIIISVNLNSSPYEFDYLLDLVVYVLSEIVFEIKTTKISTEDLEKTIKRYMDKHIENMPNTKRAFAVLDEQVWRTYFDDVTRILSKITITDLVYLLELAIKDSTEKIKKPTGNQKTKLFPYIELMVRDYLSGKSITSKYSNLTDDTSKSFGEEIALELVDVHKKINEAIKTLFEEIFDKVPEGKKDLTDYDYYKEIFVSEDVSHEEQRFIDKFFNNNNDNNISMEVACSDIQIFYPISNAFEDVINQNTKVKSALENTNGIISFSITDSRGAYHDETSEIEVRDYIESLILKSECDGILYFSPMIEDSAAIDLDITMKKSLSSFTKYIPLAILLSKADVKFDQHVKEFSNPFDDPKISDFDKILLEMKSSSYNTIESLKSSTRQKGQKGLQVVNGKMFGFLPSLTRYKEAEKLFNPLYNFVSVLDSFINFYSDIQNKIKFMPETSGTELEIYKNLDDIKDMILDAIRKDNNKIMVLMDKQIKQNSVYGGIRVHGSTSNAVEYNSIKGKGFTSNIDHSYWGLQRFMDVDIHLENPLKNLFRRELIEHIVSECLEIENGKVDDADRLKELIIRYLSVNSILIDLLYEKTYRQIKRYYTIDYTDRFSNYLRVCEDVLLQEESIVNEIADSIEKALETSINRVKSLMVVESKF